MSGLRDRQLHEGRTDPSGAQNPPSTDAVVDIRDRQELVWAAAVALGERDASLLDLHLRHGLAPAEIAEELGVEANTAHQQLFRMRNKLGDAISSYVLWRNGRPLCEGLAAAVSGQVAFDRSVSKAVAIHQKTCDQCSERRAALLDPSKLFASVPLLGVPLQLKIDAAVALHNAGVPVDPALISGGGRSLDSSDGPPSDPPAADGQGAIPEPASSPAPQPAGHSVLADTAMAYNNGSMGAGSFPTGPFEAAPHRAAPPKSTPSTALPSKALLGTMAIVGSATVLVGLIVLAAWQAGLFGLAGGDEVAADGSEIVAGPTISSETSEFDADSTGQAESTTEPAPVGDIEPDAGDSDDGAAAGGASGLSEIGSETGDSGDPAGRSDPTIETTPTTGTDGSTTTVDGGSTASTTGTTPTTRTTTTTSTTVSTTTSTSDGTKPTDSTTGTTEPDPTTTASTRDTTPTQPPDPPVILRFVSRTSTNQLRCDDRNQRIYDAIWATENTTSVQLSLPNGSRTGKPSGSVSFCGAAGDTIILVASGPGGSTKASTTLD